MSDIRKTMEAYLSMVSEDVQVDEARQFKDPKKDSMVSKGGKTIVIDKSKEKEYLRKGWQLAEKAKLDPVNDKENDKKFKNRKDKDIDNDGDVDSSDEYLHKRRKATDDAIDGGKKPAKNEKEGETEAEKDEKEADSVEADGETEDKPKVDPKKKKKLPHKDDGDETPEISKIGEKKHSVKKEDVDMDGILARLAEDFTEEQLDEISQGLAKKAFDARARRIGDLEKEKDKETNKHGRAQIDHEIGRQDKKLARSHSKSGSDKPLNKSYGDANKEKDNRSPSQKYADYKKDGGKLDRDAFMKHQRESFTSEVAQDFVKDIESLFEKQKEKKGATEPEGLLDKESPQSKEFVAKHKIDKKDHEDMEKVLPPKDVKVKKEMKEFEVIRALLSGKPFEGE